MNRWKSCSLGFAVSVVVILAALWGPEWIAAKSDETVLPQRRWKVRKDTVTA